jgi:hypothetical protein
MPTPAAVLGNLSQRGRIWSPCLLFSAKETYSINDVVYILLQGGKVIQLRKYDKFVDLGDGRKLICVSWYYSRAEMRTIRCANMSLWPEDCSYMLSTQLQALMWNTMNGKVEQKELEAVVAGTVESAIAAICLSSFSVSLVGSSVAEGSLIRSSTCTFQYNYESVEFQSIVDMEIRNVLRLTTSSNLTTTCETGFDTASSDVLLSIRVLGPDCIGR